MRKHVLLLASSCLISVSFFSSQSNGQAPEANSQAVVVFELDAARLAESDLFQTNKRLTDGPLASNKKLKLSELNRVYGAISAPTDLQSAKDIERTQMLTFEMFMQIQFKTVELADEAFEDMKTRCQPITIGGKRYFTVDPDNNKKAPKNMLVHRYAPDTIELGTESYLKLPNREVLSQNLVNTWSKMPTAAIRFGVDLEGIRHLSEEATQEMTSGPTPPFGFLPFFTIAEHASVIRFAFDFSSDTMLWLTVTGKDEAGTQKIDSVVSGLLGMCTQIGTQMLGQSGPQLKKPGEAVVEALVTQIDGNDVSVLLPNPPGLSDAVSEMMTGVGLSDSK